MSDVKTFIGEVKIEGFDDVVQVFLVNNSYYSVVYKEKEEYYTKNKNLALMVGKVILTFYKNLNLGASIFNQNYSDEVKWSNLLKFLREESSKTGVDYEICLSVYRSLEASYNDATSNNIDEKALLSRRATIRNKDNLMTMVNTVTSLFNEKEADKNLGRYKRMRNEFIKDNPQLNLNLL